MAILNEAYTLRFRMPGWSVPVNAMHDHRVLKRTMPGVTKEQHVKLAYEMKDRSQAASRAWVRELRRALKRYGDGDGVLISGVFRSHFPEEVKERLRQHARDKADYSDISHAHWRAAGRRTHTWRNHV